MITDYVPSTAKTSHSDPKQELIDFDAQQNSDYESADLPEIHPTSLHLSQATSSTKKGLAIGQEACKHDIKNMTEQEARIFLKLVKIIR
jgi:hypothetical protein